MLGNMKYRVPDELTVTPGGPKRVLIVGSCLIAGWPDVLRAHGCEADYFGVNNVTMLPETPPRPVSDYDFQIVQIPLRALLPETAYFRLSWADDGAYAALLEATKARLKQYLRGVLRWHIEQGLRTFVCNFLLPQQNPMGRLLKRHDLRNMVYFVEQLNAALEDMVGEFAGCHYFDFDQIVANFGRRYFQDDTAWHVGHNGALGDMDFDHDQARLEPVARMSEVFELKIHEFIQIAWLDLVGMYRTVRRTDAVKLVIVDIDDTIWRGVAAELDAPSPELTEGWPLGFIEALGFLKRRGVMLALCSKNDEERIAEIWPRIVGGRMLLDDFAARRINWRPKAENAADILRDINVLPENTLFIDDNPVERAAMKAAFPSIRTMGSNPYLWRRILLWSAETQVTEITSESMARTEMVRGQIERQRAGQEMSRQEFLNSLALRMSFETVANDSHPLFARALELLNKTNQFNTTGKRWERAELAIALAGGLTCVTFEVEDRFTNYGTVGIMLLRGQNLAQFVLSCRVFGMDVEVAAIAHVRGECRAFSGVIVQTDKNLACRNVYEKCGFEMQDGVWVLGRDKALRVPEHILIEHAGQEAAPNLAPAPPDLRLGPQMSLVEVIRLAEVCLSEGRFDEALNLLSQADRIEPQNYWLNLFRGRGFLGVGRVDLATESFLRAIKSGDVARIGAIYELMKLDLSRGSFERVSLVDEALGLPDEDQKRWYYAEMLFIKAILSLRAGFLADADAFLTQAYAFREGLVVDGLIFTWMRDMLRYLPEPHGLPHLSRLRQLVCAS